MILTEYWPSFPQTICVSQWFVVLTLLAGKSSEPKKISHVRQDPTLQLLAHDHFQTWPFWIALRARQDSRSMNFNLARMAHLLKHVSKYTWFRFTNSPHLFMEEKSSKPCNDGAFAQAEFVNHVFQMHSLSSFWNLPLLHYQNETPLHLKGNSSEASHNENYCVLFTTSQLSSALPDPCIYESWIVSHLLKA